MESHNWHCQVIKDGVVLKFPDKDTGEMMPFFEKEETLGIMLMKVRKSMLKNRQENG
jgi:hypothetical protein